MKLPVGAIRAEGSLRKQLELQAAGFHGQLGELSEFPKKENNAWLDPEGKGKHGWEELPYWLKGFGDCATSSATRRRSTRPSSGSRPCSRASARRLLRPARPGGAATVGSTKGKYDLWPNMVMLDCLQSYHEFTGDKRVLPS